ncbi:glycosyl hydrolase 115 family protein [Chitinophaga horti]|uniref:Glycosyl hydrolase 115 family protein n=1 Tax=Chitinophaga horti TaxID=2920382 RepID=A0ABY6IWE7_9BACT|nr:glycosyl hydrolase 115 family protein [Chitinophaga horti]UYQ91686.1 glycosyl hydrolase 115 family protein [Chitinophaga horti]
MRLFFFAIICACLLPASVRATDFDLVTPGRKVSIYYSAGATQLDSITAHLLAADIQRVTGYKPFVGTDIAKAKGNIILIGNQQGVPLQYADSLQGQWERYTLQVVAQPFPGVSQALVIAGSDVRGTAYGVFDISARIGVSPWYWWADAIPRKQARLSLNIAPFLSAPPSVQYRGIFLNDEDWGLQPWSAKTFEPELGDIGPKTYAKIFELLLRLKANMIWPAMHECTRAFYSVPGNVETAAAYHIVVGSSHAEPMLRTNTREWDKKTMGDFNYVTNQSAVDRYWEARVKQSSKLDAIYTVGMRGVHDSGIEGVKTVAETVPLLERIFQSQRKMLQQYVNPDISRVPQAFTVYKEVLEVYDAGVKVPDDVTIIWPDDNYGYIQRLNNGRERQRQGGSGVYYHASYWGRPHDYLWLPSTHPSLMQEEMTKAYRLGSRKIWVVNVGDIKSIEYNMTSFLDAAYNIQPFLDSRYAKVHLRNWVAQNTGEAHADTIAGLLWKYYDLAFERRPEFMGWSQTEPTTKTGRTAYNHQFYGDQAQRRLDEYQAIQKGVEALRKRMPTQTQDCFFQLVYYPVKCASLINQKFLYQDKAALYGQQGRVVAGWYDSLASTAYKGIVAETDYYNRVLSNGKWAHMMSMAPRKLPVFDPPARTEVTANTTSAWQVKAEGGQADALPILSAVDGQPVFLDVYLTASKQLDFTIAPSASWIRPSLTSGRLTPHGLSSQKRIWINVDWKVAPKTAAFDGYVTIKAGGSTHQVKVTARRPAAPVNFAGHSGDKGYVAINPLHYQQRDDDSRGWQPLMGLGAYGASLQAAVSEQPIKDTTENTIRRMPSVSYYFTSPETRDAKIDICTLPTCPVNDSIGVRYAVSLDNGPLRIMNFRTFGRSNEWKQAVLSNTITRTFEVQQLTAGAHELKIYVIDPGVILDRIIIDLGGLQPFYGSIPESGIINPSNQ